MKQTAVEQVGIAFRQWQKEWENYNGTKGNKPVSYDEFIKPFLEMEKQQQGYSEEEVELIANEMVNWAIDNIGNPNPESGKKFDEVMAKFKNK